MNKIAINKHYSEYATAVTIEIHDREGSETILFDTFIRTNKLNVNSKGASIFNIENNTLEIIMLPSEKGSLQNVDPIEIKWIGGFDSFVKGLKEELDNKMLVKFNKRVSKDAFRVKHDEVKVIAQVPSNEYLEMSEHITPSHHEYKKYVELYEKRINNTNIKNLQEISDNIIANVIA